MSLRDRIKKIAKDAATYSTSRRQEIMFQYSKNTTPTPGVIKSIADNVATVELVDGTMVEAIMGFYPHNVNDPVVVLGGRVV